MWCKCLQWTTQKSPGQSFRTWKNFSILKGKVEKTFQQQTELVSREKYYSMFFHRFVILSFLIFLYGVPTKKFFCKKIVFLLLFLNIFAYQNWNMLYSQFYSWLLCPIIKKGLQGQNIYEKEVQIAQRCKINQLTNNPWVQYSL